MILSGRKNANRPWSSEDDKQLREMAEAGSSVTRMALKFKRTDLAVRARLSVLKVSLRRVSDDSKSPPA
jgi:hypothetical protein